MQLKPIQIIVPIRNQNDEESLNTWLQLLKDEFLGAAVAEVKSKSSNCCRCGKQINHPTPNRQTKDHLFCWPCWTNINKHQRKGQIV